MAIRFGTPFANVIVNQSLTKMENTMTLVRYNPTRQLSQNTFSDFIDSFFDEALKTRRPLEGSFLPGMDVRETETSFEIEASLPGMKKNDIKIDLEDRVLTISGERKSEVEDKGVKYHLVESQYGSFSRSLTLPANINRDSISAGYTDGILKITIEKHENAVTRNIQIK